MLAIHTKRLGATTTKGDRIKAYTTRGLSATISYPFGLANEKAHYAAVQALVAKHNLAWLDDGQPMVYGDSADGRGYVFCFAKSVVVA